MQPKPAVDPIDEAREALQEFWGRSNGGSQALALCEERLRRCRLKSEVLDRLQMELPPIRPGTMTGDKVRRANSLLARLAAKRR